LSQMTIDAVVAGVELAAYKPFPKGRIVGVQSGVPILIPIQQIGVFAKTFWKMLFIETRDEIRIIQVGLADEFGGRIKIFFFFPMHCDLGFILFGCGRIFDFSCDCGMIRGTTRRGGWRGHRSFSFWFRRLLVVAFARFGHGDHSLGNLRARMVRRKIPSRTPREGIEASSAAKRRIYETMMLPQKHGSQSVVIDAGAMGACRRLRPRFWCRGFRAARCCRRSG
jgi:hypothetical protein